MKTTQKIFSAVVLVSFLLASAVAALAQLPALYGNRANRITSKCSLPLNGMHTPAIPPPTATDANCPHFPTIAQSPSARWSVDISWFDPVFQKYYLANRNSFGVSVIDTQTETVVGMADGFVGTNCALNVGGAPDCTVLPAPPGNSAGPNGVLTTHNPNQLWAGDGDGSVKVFSLDAAGIPTGSPPLPLATVKPFGVTRRADEMAWDPDDQLVLVAWDDDADLRVAFITVSAAPTIVGQILIPEAAGCGIEQPVYDHNLKLFFLAIPCTDVHTNGEIAVINPKTKALQTVFGTLDSTLCFPHGLALGPRDELLVGCSGDAPAGSQMQSIIMSAVDGTKIQAFGSLGGSDEVWYNPGDNRYYLAMSSWTKDGKIGSTSTPSLGIIDAGSSRGGASFIQNILTTRTSHSVAAVYDCANNKIKKCKPVNNRVFVPTTSQSGSSTNALDSGGISIYGVIP